MMRRLLGSTLAAALLLVGLAACDSPTEIDDHAVAAVIRDADGNQVASHTNVGTRTGELRVALGSQATFRISLLDAAGNEFAIDGQEYSISGIRSVIAAFAVVEMEGVDRFTVSGVDAVTTTLEFDVDHGTHTEFGVRGIPLIVEASVD